MVRVPLAVVRAHLQTPATTRCEVTQRLDCRLRLLGSSFPFVVFVYLLYSRHSGRPSRAATEFWFNPRATSCFLSRVRILTVSIMSRLKRVRLNTDRVLRDYISSMRNPGGVALRPAPSVTSRNTGQGV